MKASVNDVAERAGVSVSTVSRAFTRPELVSERTRKKVLQVAEEQKIPVIVGETDSVKRGGLLTLGLDYHALGVQTGEMAIRILTEGANPAEMPVEFQKQAKLVINTAAAERMGITLPQSLLDKADEKVS